MDKELACKKGKFTITITDGNLTVNCWQGDTKVYPIGDVPIEEVGDIMGWMDEEELDKLRDLIPVDLYEDAWDYGVEMLWIGEGE